MKITEIFKTKRAFSLEIFPPKRTDSIDKVYGALDKLKDLAPDFISVTYGAGGSGINKETLNIASRVKNNYNIESVAHLTCINSSKEEVLEVLKGYEKEGIKNILALRGDVNPEYPPKREFTHASDLISFIKEEGDFNIIGACYPEGHLESKSTVEDIRNLKLKVDSGASQLITQVFFSNEYFYSFRELTAIAGIKVPISAGIMPVVNKRQIEKMVSLCGATLPKKFLSMMNRYENNPEAMRDAGIAYAVDQIVDLIAEGVDGIHLYTMNNPYIANRIHEAVRNLL